MFIPSRFTDSLSVPRSLRMGSSKEIAAAAINDHMINTGSVNGFEGRGPTSVKAPVTLHKGDKQPSRLDQLASYTESSPPMYQGPG